MRHWEWFLGEVDGVGVNYWCCAGDWWCNKNASVSSSACDRCICGYWLVWYTTALFVCSKNPVAGFFWYYHGLQYLGILYKGIAWKDRNYNQYTAIQVASPKTTTRSYTLPRALISTCPSTHSPSFLLPSRHCTLALIAARAIVAAS